MREPSEEWITDTFLDDIAAIELLEDPRHVIPEELWALLSPLYGVCTHDLLHQARIHRYGDNYHLSPGVINTPVSYWLTDNHKHSSRDLLEKAQGKISQGTPLSTRPIPVDSHGVVHLCPSYPGTATIPMDQAGVGYIQCTDQAESLLAIGRIGHVPNNTPHTTNFAKHVEDFVQYVLKKNLALHKPLWSNSFTVRPIGSYPCDTKVGDIDEFDYLVMVDFEHTTSDVSVFVIICKK